MVTVRAEGPQRERAEKKIASGSPIARAMRSEPWQLFLSNLLGKGFAPVMFSETPPNGQGRPGGYFQAKDVGLGSGTTSLRADGFIGKDCSPP